MPKFRRGERLPTRRGDMEASLAGALEGQRVLVFKDASALARFLDKLDGRVNLLGRLDALNALRVGFADYDDLACHAGWRRTAVVHLSGHRSFPRRGQRPVRGRALGNHLLEWLGITGDNSAWGKGVTIAILDTGVTPNSAFRTTIRSINLIDPPTDPSAQNGHGTAVASFIGGDSTLTPGVAPGASLLSIRIADDNGLSDSFLLAKGIVAAADAGVQLINISMGSDGDSALVSNAIAYAREKGALIIASAGNNGINQVSYPAANDGVIAVGAVDALGNHLDFSNSGTAVALSAPGYGLNAAWTGDQAMSVTGTSFSAPIVTGAIAAIMTEAGKADLTAAQAYQLLVSYLNDGGAAGQGRAVGWRHAGHRPRAQCQNPRHLRRRGRFSTASSRRTREIPTARSRCWCRTAARETLINTTVRVSTGAGVVTRNITTLAPNAVQTVRVPISRPTVLCRRPAHRLAEWRLPPA